MDRTLNLKVCLIIAVVWIPTENRTDARETLAHEHGQQPRVEGIDFEAVSIDIEPFGKPMMGQVEHIRIAGSGVCEYRIEERPASGAQKRLPPFRQVYMLDLPRLRQLQKLLEETDWLTATGAEGRARHTHPTTYTITLVRKGAERTIRCHGRKPEPYKSLIWFFQGIAHQENLLYKLRWFSSRDFDVCSELQSNIKALQGKSGRAYPVFDIDYSRYAPIFKDILREPYSNHKDEIITAIKLLTFLEDKSERDHIAGLVRDHDRSIRNTAAKAMGDLGDIESIPVLAELVDSSEQARWSLIRLGQPAVPTIAKLIERGTLPKDLRSEALVRAYIEHWRELPEPVDERIVTAARKALTTEHTRAYRTEYHERFLELAENEPVQPGGILCQMDYLNVKCYRPLRFIHGWYTVVDSKIVESGACPSPDAGTELFETVKFKPAIEQGHLVIRSGWQPIRGVAGSKPEAVIDEKKIEVGDETELKVIYSYYRKPIRIPGNLRTLWEGYLIEKGIPVKRLVYAARIAEPGESAQAFAPPAAPASPMGKLPPSRPRLVFRGVELTKSSLIRDPAVLVDLSIAWKNDAIKKQGGTPRDTAKTTVVYEFEPKEDASRHGVVFADSAKKVFYIQIQFKQDGSRHIEFHGPFEGDPREKLKL